MAMKKLIPNHIDELGRRPTDIKTGWASGNREIIVFYLCSALISLFIFQRVVLVGFRNSITESEQKISLVSRRILQEAKTMAELKANQKILSILDVHFNNNQPIQEKQSRILSEIEEQGKKNNLIVKSLKPLSVTQGSFGNMFPVEIQMEGTMPDLFVFLNFVQQEAYFYDVDSFLVNKQRIDADQLQIKLVLSRKYFEGR